MKDISEVRKAMDTTQEMFEPLHQMIVMLKQHGVDVSGVQVAEKDVQVRTAFHRGSGNEFLGFMRCSRLISFMSGRT